MIRALLAGASRSVMVNLCAQSDALEEEVRNRLDALEQRVADLEKALLWTRHELLLPEPDIKLAPPDSHMPVCNAADDDDDDYTLVELLNGKSNGGNLKISLGPSWAATPE